MRCYDIIIISGFIGALLPWIPGMPCHCCQSYLESQPMLKLLIALHQDT